MRVLVFAAALLGALASPLHAQSPLVLAFLDQAFGLEASSEVQAMLDRGEGPGDPLAVWREALVLSRTELMREPTGRASLARLMEAAVLASGAQADEVPLDRLDPADLAALEAAVGFPRPDDLARYLFARAPDLHREFDFEAYAVVREIVPQRGIHVIRERSSSSAYGLSARFTLREVPAAEDPVGLQPGERARTRRLNLAAVPSLVIAAKAYRAAERAPDGLRPYPLLIALEALRLAAAANPQDFRLVPYKALWAAIRPLGARSTLDPVLDNISEDLRRAIPREAFFARQFGEAADAYAIAELPPNDARAQLWSAWGTAVSRFAYGDETGAGFAEIASALTYETRSFGRMFRLLLRHMSPSERERFPNVAAWKARLTTLYGPELERLSDEDWIAFNQDFLRILETIGRADIAVRYLMTEADRMNRLGPRPYHQAQILFWLAPFVNDLCKQISFRMSEFGGWQLRPVTGYPRSLDFLDSVDDAGELVGPGQVVLRPDPPGPYGATSPEEDCATAVAVHGVAGTDLFGLAVATPHGDAVQMVAGFERWVEEALTRSAPTPSAVPFLKLVWIEWLSQAFQPLADAGATGQDFRYAPLHASELATPDAVADLAGHPAITPHLGEMLAVMDETRRFLSSRYP